jgi:hypothetical protein
MHGCVQCYVKVILNPRSGKVLHYQICLIDSNKLKILSHRIRSTLDLERNMAMLSACGRRLTFNVMALVKSLTNMLRGVNFFLFCLNCH